MCSISKVAQPSASRDAGMHPFLLGWPSLSRGESRPSPCETFPVHLIPVHGLSPPKLLSGGFSGPLRQQGWWARGALERPKSSSPTAGGRKGKGKGSCSHWGFPSSLAGLSGHPPSLSPTPWHPQFCRQPSLKGHGNISADLPDLVSPWASLEGTQIGA